MKDLHDIFANRDEQDRGAELELMHPVTGLSTGMTLTIAGPDSRVQRASRLALSDALAERLEQFGAVSAEARDAEAIAMLARCVLRWDVKEGGEPLLCDIVNVRRLLSIAWVRDQVDAFAGDRSHFMRTV